MSTTYEQIMEDVSYALIEPIYTDTIVAISIVGGIATVTPFSVYGLYVGAMVLIGTAGANQESVTITAVSAPTFTAAVANSHIPGEPIVGATFPSGQLLAPLFTQAEIIGYINDAQSDFLLNVRPLYEVVDEAVVVGQRNYTQPTDCIRLERIAINPQPNDYNSSLTDLYETSQESLDMSDPQWQGNQGVPTQWFRDEISNESYGYYPLPSTNLTAELWYSQNLPPGSTPNLLTTLLVPDAFAHAVKYSVLAKCWTKDGETRDPDRAMYCEKRTQMTMLLAVKFMTGLGVSLEQGTRNDPDFSPMPMGQ